MSDTFPFARLVLLVAAAGLLALLSNRLTERIRIPAPLLVLVAAAVAVKAVPDLHHPPERLVERLVTLALIAILFDGGLHLGWSKFRAAAAPIAVVGVAGHLSHRRGGRRLPALDVRAGLVPGAAGGHRDLADRPGGGLLGAGTAGGRPGAAAPSWRASPAPTTRSASR